jgi:presenilin-like A22 family membrane protease
MKHNPKIISILILLFFVAHILGLFITSQYLEVDSLPLNIERPDMAPETTLLSIFIIILIGTAIALILLKYKLFRLWKLWFFLSVFLTLTISFSVFISEVLAVLLALGFALWKIWRPNVYVHNFTELFIYGALAAIFVPILSIWTISFLLVLISIYDYIAVRKTKHMVTLAKSQGESKVFAGLMIPYKKNLAILGGGDIGFPLIFSGVVLSHFNLTLLNWQTYLIPISVTFMLAVLFFKGDQKEYYPAMPYLSLGCLLGLVLVLLSFSI